MFFEETGIPTDQKLPLEVSLTTRRATLSIPGQKQSLGSEITHKIANFLADRITLLYIPAVRTRETALTIADEILASRRRELLRSAEYAEILKQLEDLDKKAVADVESFLKATLTHFIPKASSVQLEARSISRASILEDILVDDGVLTSIAAKGDGIQSLISLALTMEWTQSTNRPDRQLIIAVEEPESHLHPGAVREIRRALEGIAKSQQVIVTTHNQALINFRDLKQNVIVSDRSARSARDLAELRTTLGVQLSDALVAAEVMVICEGYHDELLLPTILAQRDPTIKDWLSDGRLVIESAGSGSKIYPRVQAARSILTQPIVVLDGDPAGKKDVEKLLSDGVIEQTSVVQIVRPSCKNSELEDILLPGAYLEKLQEKIETPLTDRSKNKLDQGRDKAWSERLLEILINLGFSKPERLVKTCKYEVIQSSIAAAERGEKVVRPECEDLLDRIIGLIRQHMQER